MKNDSISQIVKVTLPVFFGYLAIGIPFGLMVINAGYPVWLSPVMSILMYAGAGQYIAITLFASGASLSTIAITELLVNIRHIVYGLSLINKFKNLGKCKAYIIFALTDETYSLLTSCDVPNGISPKVFYTTIAALNHFYWILGGIIGAVAGKFIPFSFTGVDFALTSLFVVLLIEQIKKTHDAIPSIIGVCTTVITIILSRIKIIPSSNILIVALALGIATLIFSRKRND